MCLKGKGRVFRNGLVFLRVYIIEASLQYVIKANKTTIPREAWLWNTNKSIRIYTDGDRD